MPTPTARQLFAIALISAAALALEVLLMRLFSIIQWHHFAYMVISLALLGFGVSGTFLSLWGRRLLGPGDRPSRTNRVLGLNAALFALTAPGCFFLAQAIPFNPLELAWDPLQWGYSLAVYVLLAIPFFAAANCIGLAFMAAPQRIHLIYNADLIGAGLGALAVIALLLLLPPVACLFAIAALGWVTALLFAGGGRCGRWLAALCVVGLALPWAWPDGWRQLRPSEYKGLSTLLQVAGARLVAERSGPLGLLSVVESPLIPLRYAPGLSLRAPQGPPPQLALFTDADGLSPIDRFDGDWEAVGYLDYLGSALPYHLLEAPRVTVVGAGGGSQVLQALALGARSVEVLEVNEEVVDLLRGPLAHWSGNLYQDSSIEVHIAEARSHIAASTRPVDLIQLALVDAAASGIYAMAANYLYTREALGVYLDHLAPGGMIAITRWLKLPPRDGLKLFATAIDALRARGTAEGCARAEYNSAIRGARAECNSAIRGTRAECNSAIQDAGAHLAMIRGWRTTTLIISKAPLTSAHIQRIREFSDRRGFDLVWLPGMEEDQANRYNLLPEPYFYQGVRALLGPGREEFMGRYKFYIEPASDDRPYFFHTFKWRTLPELLDKARTGGLPLVEWGYLVLVATLAQALLASVVLILLPLRALRGARTKLPSPAAAKSGRSRPQLDPAGGAVVAYFGLLGLAFLFIEIAFLQRFTLFLGHPLYAGAVVLGSFLVAAGLGSGVSRRLRSRQGLRLVATGIALLALGYVCWLPTLLAHLMGLALGARIGLAIGLIAPLGFLMGMPFPIGLDSLPRAVVPWAWAINGCASVISAVLATLVAVHFGFATVVWLAAGMYLLAAFLFSPLAHTRAWAPGNE